MRIAFPVLMVLSALTLSAVSGEFVIRKVGDSVVEAKALNLGDKKYGRMGFGRQINGCSFQQDAVVTHKDHQYVGYYDGERRVCIARRKLPKGSWKGIRFSDYKFKNNDAHNTISVGICTADGTIHMAFDHHVHPLHYRVSKKDAATNPDAAKWEAALFSPIRSDLEKGKKIKVTYPRFLPTPKGGLQFFYRRGGSGNGDRMMVDYDPTAGTWKGTRQIDSGKGKFQDGMGKSTSRCSYPNGYSYGPKGSLHATWVWRESSQGANHDLIYTYSRDGGKTWLNNNDQPIKGTPNVSTPGIKVVSIPRKYGLMNTHGQAVDSKGRIHAVMRHCSERSLKEVDVKPGAQRFGPAKARRNFHYWRSADKTWERRELPGGAGSRPKIFIDKGDNAFVIFNRGTDLVILAAGAAAEWNDWKVIHTEKGPFGNEMLGDPYRWKESGILSVMVQEKQDQGHTPTPLRILAFKLEAKAK